VIKKIDHKNLKQIRLISTQEHEEWILVRYSSYLRRPVMPKHATEFHSM
jgi:hypothetical protein